MNDERLFGLLAAHDGQTEVAPGFEDRLYALLLAERQGARRTARPVLLVAALLAVLAISAAAAIGSGLILVPWRNETPSPSPSEELVPSPEPSFAALPNLDLPGFGPAPAGLYGWTGGPGATTAMHGSAGTGPGEIQLRFTVLDDCFSLAPFAVPPAPEPTPLTVAGLNGLYVEPYNVVDVLFHGSREGVTTGAYALPIGDRTLCVYLSWDTQTSAADLEANRQILESMRGVPYGNRGIRITFRLPSGWDRG